MRIHYINLLELGCDPVLVKEGQFLDLIVQEESGQRFFYFSGGNPSCYENIEGNLPDFRVERSSTGNNGTSDNRGMFPGIIYSHV